MQKITVICFTYKRAMQLESCIESLLENFKNRSGKIHIIYHKHQDHHKSYLILKKKYKKKNIYFYERKKIFFLKNFFLLLRPLNLLWILKWPKILTEFNNFKFLVEKIIQSEKNQFVTFVPDDQIFFKKTEIPHGALLKIIQNKSYYRFFTGNNFKGEFKIPKDLKVNYFKEKGVKYFQYINTPLKGNTLWNYRFTIEGTVFHKETLLKLLKPMIYHNPITLEANGLWEARIRNFFKIGISTAKRTAATYQINNVQNLVNTPSGIISTNFLLKKFMKNKRLLIKKKEFNNRIMNIIPKKIKFK